MSRSLALFAIGLVFGGGAGFVIAASSGSTFESHDHTDPAQHGGNMEMAAHDHSAATNLPADSDAPSVAIQMIKDPMAGWNLRVTPQNFRFAPENASTADVPGEGHAHVYINGEKLGRVYGPWLHIASLPKGEVTVEVTLNSNDHRPLSVNGTAISASTTLTVD